MNHKSCYQAVLSHDTRFDGVFFVGVSTTKIYCRTVCTVKTPRSENCRFFTTAASAEQSGFRPCLRCRPELAPGNARIDAVSRLAASAINRIEDGSLTEKRLDEFAAEMGVTDRHLRRVIQTELGVSPIELIQTQRLLLAKRLLTDTNLPITEIAFASGFASLRRFNALFKERYRLNPTELRKTRSTAATETLVCELAFRPPFDWGSLLDYLKARALQGVEIVEGNRY
ncbi:MAG: bifunctional transcriptional activator/DNA repair enzyme AdaA, partial [Blastocatellia bacterium]